MASKRGRPRVYETESAKKRAKVVHNKMSYLRQINIGKCLDSWTDLKTKLSIDTDEGLAQLLLDRFVALLLNDFQCEFSTKVY